MYPLPHHIPGQRQRGVALFVVLVFVMLSMLLALWASRTSLFNELVVGNDADYQRAFEAAQALLQDAELDIRDERPDGTACNAAGCRDMGSAKKIPLSAQEVTPLLADLDAQPTKCQDGLCVKRTGRQDFWNYTSATSPAPTNLQADEFKLEDMTKANVGARYGDNYGSNTGSNGGGTSQYDGDITSDGSLLLYNFFHDSWAIDFSRWTYSNNKFIMTNTKVSKAADLAVQNGAEDSGNSLWNPAVDGALITPFMPVPGATMGVDFTAAKRQDTYSAWPGTFTVRLSAFSSQTVTTGWRVAGRTSPEAESETVIASGTSSSSHWRR